MALAYFPRGLRNFHGRAGVGDAQHPGRHGLCGVGGCWHVGAVIYSFAAGHEVATVWKVFFLAMIIGGIVGLKAVS